MRIEVGYGLEGTLTDVAASRIIRDRMTPRFKEGNYDRGVSDGVDAIIATLEGRARIGAGKRARRRARAGAKSLVQIDGPELAWPMRILLGAFIFGIIGIFTVVGVMTPGVGWFLYVFLIPFWAMFPHHHRRYARRAVAAWHLRRRLSDRQADPVAAAVVSEGGAAN